MTKATRLAEFTSTTVIKLLLSFIKLPSESIAIILRLGKTTASPKAKGKQSPILRAKKFGPWDRTLNQNGALIERLVTANMCSSTRDARNFRQSKRFTRAPPRSTREQWDDCSPGTRSCLPGSSVSSSLFD